MQIQFLNAPDFEIDSSGTLHRTGSWLLCADWFDSDISASAQAWAGTVGDAWRIPNTDGNDYTSDPQLTIIRIKCQSLDSRTCKVTFYGSSAAADDSPISAIEGSFRFERRKDLTEYKTARFLLPGNNPENMPQVGELINWAGDKYRCESAVAEEQSDGSFMVTLSAVNIAISQEGRINTEQNASFEQIKTGNWLIMPDALESFLQSNALHHPAPWAGENFYVFEVKTEPSDSALRTRVSISARYACLQLLETLRREEIVSLGSTTPEKLYIWTSRWRAQAADQQIFETMLGSEPSGWAAAGTIVCKVTPQRISDCEFEYHLEARYPETVGMEYSHKYWRDRDLPDRMEYYTRVGEMRFSPVQCGYMFRNGNYTAMNNWNPQQQCPLQTTGVLPLNWINQPIKLLEIVEVSYLSGTSRKNLRSISSWFNSNRTLSTTIAGITGIFLRYDLDVDDVTDSRDRQWTRITKVYRMSPQGYTWNTNFWI